MGVWLQEWLTPDAGTVQKVLQYCSHLVSSFLGGFILTCTCFLFFPLVTAIFGWREARSTLLSWCTHVYIAISLSAATSIISQRTVLYCYPIQVIAGCMNCVGLTTYRFNGVGGCPVVLAQWQSTGGSSQLSWV